MTGKLKVIAAVLDTRQLTLYHPDGSTTVLPQGDERIRKILDIVTPICSRGGVAELDLEHTNTYAAFEKKTNGLVKLFRVAKKAVQGLFNPEAPLAPTTVGEVPEGLSGTAPTAAIIDEIMANAMPVSSPDYRESETTGDHTMVAVVGTGADTKIVPGVEALRPHMAHAVKLGSTKGVQALINRLGAAIQQRGHTVEDVLRFMEKGDLQAADDGYIVAYKVLRRHPTLKDTFVDCHTKQVVQKVGDFVCMDESLVDPSRRTECSTGLHIARRGYLRYFRGDVCTIVKIAPEDVIAVPVGEPDKVRARGYHILGVLPEEDWAYLTRGQPVQSNEAKRLLAQALSGDHIARLQQVKITAAKGGSFENTPLLKGANVPKALTTGRVKSGPKAVALDDESVKTESKPVDPKAIAQKVAKAKTPAKKAAKKPYVAPTVTKVAAPAPKVQGSPRQDEAKRLLALVTNSKSNTDRRRKAAQDLVAFKKKVKVSWATLGIDEPSVKIVLTFIGKAE